MKKSLKYFIPAGIIIVILALIALFSLTDIFQPASKKVLLAKVGPREIHVEQFKREMSRRSRRSKNLDKKMILEEMINYETLLTKAFEAGLDKDPEVIRSYHNLLIGKLKRNKLNPRIKSATVTDEDMQAYYEENIDTYTRRAKARMAIIHIKTHPKMSQEKLSGLKERMAEAREKSLKLTGSARGFGQVAINYSEDQATRYKGGDIGWISKGRKYRWPAEVTDTGFSLESGGISDIITTDTGLFLVKVSDKRESVVTPLKKVKRRLRHKLLLEKRKTAEKTFQEEMRAATAIEIYPEALDAIPLPEKNGPGSEKPPAF